MAVKGKKSRRERREEKAAGLAPPEERDPSAAAGAKNSSNGGAIIVDTGKLNLPKGLDADNEERRTWLGLEPVVLIILAFALTFIAFIAYMISIGK